MIGLRQNGREWVCFPDDRAVLLFLMIPVVTIYCLFVRPSLHRGAVQHRSVDTDSLSGHLGGWDIRVAPAFCGKRIGLFKDTTGSEGGAGGGNAATLPILWVRLQPVTLHNSLPGAGTKPQQWSHV